MSEDAVENIGAFGSESTIFVFVKQRSPTIVPIPTLRLAKFKFPLHFNEEKTLVSAYWELKLGANFRFMTVAQDGSMW